MIALRILKMLSVDNLSRTVWSRPQGEPSWPALGNRERELSAVEPALSAVEGCGTESLCADLHPNTRKTRVLGTPGPAAQGKFLLRVLRPDFASPRFAFAHLGQSAQVVP